MRPKMEIRIWESSSLIGKKVGDINKDYGITIIKVARGSLATNPDKELALEEADYISFIGDKDSCLKVLSCSGRD